MNRMPAEDRAEGWAGMSMHRREFLVSATAMAAAGAERPAIPIIDTHIHLFDPGRPQGVPWPAKDDAVLYRAALPERYRALAVPLGIRGAIEVECSPWLEDNQWVLDVAARDHLIVGTVGDLEPGKPEFRRQLERFHRNPLFRGIRYGNLWGRSLGEELGHPEFVAGLKELAGAGLVLDTANPDAALIQAVRRVASMVPELRIVIDHLPQMEVPAGLEAVFGELGQAPHVYVKISQVFRRVDGRVRQDLKFYRSRLDFVFDTFGEDRVLYGSDWPNCDQWAPYGAVLKLVEDYFADKSVAAAEKYFWKNSAAAYRWVRREATQPSG